MAKKAVSLTLDEANLLWLKARGYGRGNLSAAIDDLITEARTGRLGGKLAARSVVGTIDLADGDPLLQHADGAVQGLFAASLSRQAPLETERAGTEPGRPRRNRG
jgi:hypothetical protein